MSDIDRWVIYKCNICDKLIARKLEAYNGAPVTFEDDIMVDVCIMESGLSHITWGIGKCLCDEYSKIRPSYTLAGHCREKDIPEDVVKDTIKEKIYIKGLY